MLISHLHILLHAHGRIYNLPPFSHTHTHRFFGLYLDRLLDCRFEECAAVSASKTVTQRALMVGGAQSKAPLSETVANNACSYQHILLPMNSTPKAYTAFFFASSQVGSPSPDYIDTLGARFCQLELLSRDGEPTPRIGAFGHFTLAVDSAAEVVKRCVDVHGWLEVCAWVW
jgi:hypothetical protein